MNVNEMLQLHFALASDRICDVPPLSRLLSLASPERQFDALLMC